MITLGTMRAPYQISLPYGIVVTVRPLTSTGMATAQSAARRRLEALEAQVQERREAGLPAEELPDLDDPAGRDGLFQALLVQEMATRHITKWDGVTLADGETPAPVSREAAAAVLDLYPVGERFYQEFTLRQVLLNAAKNGSGPARDGTSGEAAGPTTAEDAPITASPAPAKAEG
jgi:hypothetical protein